MDLKYAPVSIVNFVAWMEQMGLSANIVRADGAHNQVIQYAHETGLVVQLLADRRQWFIDVGRSEWGDDWFDSDTWEACLNDTENKLDLTPLDQQAHWIEEHWSSLLALGNNAPHDCLSRKRKKRAYARMGFPEPA